MFSNWDNFPLGQHFDPPDFSVNTVLYRPGFQIACQEEIRLFTAALNHLLATNYCVKSPSAFNLNSYCSLFSVFSMFSVLAGLALFVLIAL